ncbi:MAG: efflux RND transporter periplasmic adaptor subunit [Gemmatimonadota bacterium]
MRRKVGAFILLLLAVLLAFAIGGCNRNQGEASTTAGDQAQIITPENIAVVIQDTIESGPAISGALTPDRAAVIRAELGGSLVQTFAEKGQSVARGQVLARIEDSSLREAVLSARSAVRTAEQSLQVAKRNAERAQALAQAGAMSDRDLEQARWNVTNAESQLADAAARCSLAERQLSNTQVRAPFNGIVAEKPASPGDVVSPGTPLFTIVDPTRMKLEAAVPAAQIGAVRIGAPVQFTVQGYPGRVFTGRVERVSPAADPATRQVGVYIAIPNSGGSLVGGLFAEGRIGSERRGALVAPLNAVDLTGPTASVVKLENGKVERVEVRVGVRDDENERIEIVNGAVAGDTLLIGAAQGISIGSLVKVQALETPVTRR